MKASERLLGIEKSIKKYNPGHFTCLLEIEGMERPLLLSASKGASRKIRIYNDTNGLNSIAVIRYSLNGQRIYISDLEVNYDYQRRGIGKLLMELAITHGDILGANYIYGHAFPTAAIKGASELGYKAEVDALIKFYQAAGCNIKDLTNNSTKAFTQSWNNGDKIDNASLKVQIITESIAEHEALLDHKHHGSETDISTANFF